MQTHKNTCKHLAFVRYAEECRSLLLSSIVFYFFSFSSLHNMMAGSLPPTALIGNFSWCVYSLVCAKPSSISIVDSLATARLLLQFVFSINPQSVNGCREKGDGRVKDGSSAGNYQLFFFGTFGHSLRLFVRLLGVAKSSI